MGGSKGSKGSKQSNKAPSTFSIERSKKTPIIRVFIGILSSPDHIQRRMVCRKTWLSEVEKINEQPASKVKWHIEYGFVVGKPVVYKESSQDEVDYTAVESLEGALATEQARWGDILHVPSVEGYRNLAWKVEELMKYADQRYNLHNTKSTKSTKSNTPGTSLGDEYVLVKTDDDTYIHLMALLAYAEDHMENPAHPGMIYMGYMNKGVRRQTDPSHMWYDGVYDKPIYPPYALGSAYVLGGRLVSALLRLEERLRIPVEDVGVGVWVAAYAAHQRESLSAKNKAENVENDLIQPVERIHMNKTVFPLITTKSNTFHTLCSNQLIVRRHCDDPSIMILLHTNPLYCLSPCTLCKENPFQDGDVDHFLQSFAVDQP